MRPKKESMDSPRNSPLHSSFIVQLTVSEYNTILQQSQLS